MLEPMPVVTKQMMYDVALDIQSMLTAMQSDLNDCLAIQVQIRETIHGMLDTKS